MVRSKLWSQEENEFLKNNYPQHGTEFCSINLNRTNIAVRNRARKIGLKRDQTEKLSKYEKDFFSNVVKNSQSYTDAVRNLGLPINCGNRNTIKKYIDKYKLDISHFDFGASKNKGGTKKKNLDIILVENSTYSHNVNLKNRLYKEGVKERKCEKCGQGEIWNGEHMSLILDHINGEHTDNRIENLRIVCPNCNATLPTHGGKNINVKRDYHLKIKAERAQEKLNKIDNRRKVKNRPSYEILTSEIKAVGFSATGRKYGVSDNAIRKWVKSYESNK